MAPHSRTLAWKVPWTEEPGGLQSMGSQLSNFTFTFHFPLSCIGEGNGNPLLPRESWDGGACWAAVYGVVQSRARLKQLSSSSVFFYYMELQSLQKYCLISNIAKKSLNIHHQLYKIRRGF